ncbi:hypothetical protein [Rahnella sp. ChDrAdgB13]|uniref:hypothetical protein n=1 Tax=Rahnella sp. ChDrAdgB13 TaxID=1850581 RepID=UPI001AD85F33|nr:hypothetical protein [Rahnella sp. ChDrAdgB13]
MKQIYISVVCVGLLFLSSAQALDLAGYLKLKEKSATSATTKIILNSYLQGVAESEISTSAIEGYTHKDDKQFVNYSCPPKDLVIDDTFVSKMVDVYILGGDRDVDLSAPVALAYVAEMAKSYPCK